jgi:hypothetical protein
MKKYNQFIKENMNIDFLHNLDDDELREKLDVMFEEQELLEDQIRFIRSILRERKEKESEEKFGSLPKSIFDLDDDQLNFVFQKNQSEDKVHHDLANRYFIQLDGVYVSGFNKETEQAHFVIVTRYSMDDNEEKFELKTDVVDSIKFLGNKLKRMDGGYVLFGLLYSHDSHNYMKQVHYISENNIIFSDYGKKKYDSIESLLEYIVEDDLSSKETDRW